MKFSFSAEQDEFRSNLRRFLADRSPTKEVRRLMETDAGYERAAWQAMNAELGLTAVRVPEEYGGHGFGFSEQCIVLEEMGRALLCAPYFATSVLATAPLRVLGQGRGTACLEDGARWACAVNSRRPADRWRGCRSILAWPGCCWRACVWSAAPRYSRWRHGCPARWFRPGPGLSASVQS